MKTILATAALMALLSESGLAADLPPAAPPQDATPKVAPKPYQGPLDGVGSTLNDAGLFPILLFGEQTPFLQTAWGRVALVLIAYPVAAVSYRYIEQPFLHLKSRFEPNEIKHFAQPKDEASVQLNAQASS